MIDMEKLKEIRGKLEERRKRLADIFAEAGPEYDMDKVTSIGGDSKAKVDAIRSLNNEIDDLVKEAEPLEKELAELERGKRHADDLGRVEDHPGHGGKRSERNEREPLKSFGELFVASKAYTERVAGGIGPVDEVAKELTVPELKTLFQTTAGWGPESLRTGRVMQAATRPIQIIDLIPDGATTMENVVYMEETTFTNAAAEAAEGGAYAEAALALTERSQAVRKIAVWLPVTDEQLEDVAQAESYVNARLPFMVRQRLDSQILNGNGTAPNLLGFLNVAGIQTQAKGADPTPDAVYKAMTKVRVTGRAQPSAFIAHPNDWQEVRLLRTADGIYIWGNPSEAAPERIWGLPVAQSDAIAEGTGLVGDYANFTQLVVRRGIDVQVGYQSDDFIKGRRAIRADMRAAVVTYRPAALCTVTGI